MGTIIRPRYGEGARWWALPVFMFVLLSCAGTVSAEDVTVNCPADSINSALADLDKNVPNRILISGTCAEAVVVDGFNDLFLWSDSGSVIHRPQQSVFNGTPALTVNDSRGVGISGLTFADIGLDTYTPPLVRIDASTVSIEGCTISGGPAAGIGVGNQSEVNIAGSTIQDNAGEALSAVGTAHVQVAAYWPYDLVIVQRNRTGISAGGVANVELGNVTIQNNRQSAVEASSSATVTVGSWWDVVPVPQILENGSGVIPGTPATLQAQDAAEIWLVRAVIHDNNNHGAVAVGGGSITACCWEDDPIPVSIVDNEGYGLHAWAGGQVHAWAPLLVEGNRMGGLSIVEGSLATLLNGVVIQHNGNPTDPDSYGGFFVENGSALSLANTTLFGNHGPGLFLRGNSSVRLGENVAITDNEGYGVLLELGSSAAFGDTVNVSGNRKSDLACTSGSLAGAPKGSHPSIGKMQCKEWYQLQRLPE